MTSTPASSPILLTGRVATPAGVLPDGAVVVEREQISYAGPRADLPPQFAAVPAADLGSGATVLPGLVDIHCHGGAGGEFGPSIESARVAADFHHRSGSTTLIGSLVSAAPQQLLAGARTVAALVADQTLAGVHLEGPFISQARRGAHDPSALRDPDPELIAEIAEAAGPGFAQLTWAPERAGGDAVPIEVARAGAVAALGHTDTDFAGAAAALQSAGAVAPRGGLPLVTHLFNGMPQLLSRAPGPVAASIAAAARGEAVVELIADGVHLDAGTVRMVFDAVGPDHAVVVSDAMAAAGLTDGDYRLGSLAVRVQAGTARLVDGDSIAGGVTVLLDQIRWLRDVVGLSLHDAVTMASATPARTLALSGVGQVVAGGLADLLVVDDALTMQRVMRRGTWLA